jgi:hypothetical protein
MRGSGAVFRGEDDRDLGAVLDELKSAGCAVLVTGTAPEACVAASRKLFGDPGQRRRRVLVTHETGPDADRWLPEGASVTDDTELLSPPLVGRDTASKSPAGDDSVPTDEPTVGGDVSLDRLRNDLSDVISGYQSDRLEPGEVRVGITSADALASKYGRDELLSFVRTATALIRGVRGLGHLQLGQSRDGDLVPLLEDLFDARVEVRQQPGLPAEQRWHVPGYGTTEWIRIED